MGQKKRSAMVLTAVAVGVAGVLLLSGLGEGARDYVIDRFNALGSHLLIVLPGRNETSGGRPPMTGETARDLTLEDAWAITRSPYIARMAPLVLGAAPVSWSGRERESNVVGTTAEFFAIRSYAVAQGFSLPKDDPDRSHPVCILGETVRRELFGSQPALGEWIRLGDSRYRVIGILANRGQATIGINLDEVVILPVASAMRLFNTASLFRILAEAKNKDFVHQASQSLRQIITERHEGEDDITILAQDSLLATFDRILGVLTLGITGVGAISLLVSGILIMNVMWIAVSQRQNEIGILLALGAPRSTILKIFLAESLLLSIIGGSVGIVLGLSGNALIHHWTPDFAMHAPHWAIATSFGLAIFMSYLFGVIPARRAAKMDPVQALSSRS